MNDKLTDAAIAGFAYRAGFRGQALETAVAVALAESGGHSRVLGDVAQAGSTWGPSVGLWQIRSVRSQTGTGGQRDERANLDPATNARHAYQISGHGRNWRPWSTYLHGSYRAFLTRARAAAQRAEHAPQPSPHQPAQHRPSGHRSTRIVLDLGELRRFETLMDTSRHRVEHSARVARSLAGTVAADKRLDAATLRLLSDLFDALDGTAGLPMTARHLDFEARLVRRVHDLAAHADGADGRYGPEDLVPFLRRNGVPDTLAEAAVVEALAAGVVRRGRGPRRAAPSVPHLPPRHAMKSGDIVPAALAGLHNGHLPAARLGTIGAGQRLYRPVAVWYRRMAAAAGTVGVRLTPTSGYRDVAQQRRLYDLYRGGRGSLAAPPGHSDHGWGLSVDIDVRSDPHALSWLRTNGSRFGFFNDVPGEPWHWTYRPA